ncbi:tripartite tricarboxylate transporter substrate binding protein [Sabulicella rubraurantiaca]|uniref:tripartite tricarboxylate transporter substrate binding protein n=1 Tax=Sabulicella rubraurantiaca TaxID=2811429 RepID=UPI001A95BE24|nr:tripartite tricarboxylate transporter substrate binding protein [Sabulicella rubraurantiaca]
MNITRRHAAILPAALAMAGTAAAQPAFPSRPVTLVAGFPPGGTVDLLGRILAPKLTELWRQPVLVENRPGGSGIVASQAVAAAPPDGHLLMIVPITHVTNASLHRSLPFDPIADFTPITLMASLPLMLVVGNNQPARNVTELMALVRERPGRLNCGSGGNGTSQHLACELFKSSGNLDIAHVPYRGNAAALTDVMSGQIEMLFDQMAVAVPHVREGRVRALAVTTAQRSPALPDVPTVAEAGIPGFEATAWFGLVGPPRMAPEVASRIQRDVASVLALQDVRDQLSNQGLTLVGGSPAEFGTFLRSEMTKWSEVIRRSGARVD